MKKYTIKNIININNDINTEQDSFFRHIIIEILKKIKLNHHLIVKYKSSLYDLLKKTIYNIKINIDDLYDEIKNIINDIKIFNNIKPDEIITIIQYEGICWFTAFLTCICYSDLNRQIVYNKISIKY